MMWVPVLTLPDGGTVEAVLPSSATVTAADLVCSYRIQRVNGEIVEFVTLPALATHLRGQFDQHTYDALVDDIRSFAHTGRPAQRSSI